MSTPLPTLQAARPELRVDGRVQAGLAGGLFELRTSDEADGLHHAELLVNNWGVPDGGGIGYLHFDRRMLDFGKSFEIRVAGQMIFDGRITALEAVYPAGGAPMLRVLAEDRLQDLRMTRRTRSFADVSDADVLRRIASDHGLQAQVSLSGPQHKLLVQIEQSDLAFARERCRSAGAELWVDGRTLHAAPRPDRGGTALTLVRGGRLREFTVRADLATQHTALVLSGWDIGAKQAIRHEAAAAVLAAEVGNDESGATLLGRAFGSRQRLVAHTVPLASDEARAMAQAAFRQAARRFVSGHGVADCDPQLRVGRSVELQGLGPLFSGRYQVCGTCVRFDAAQGLRTEFRVERPGLGRT